MGKYWYWLNHDKSWRNQKGAFIKWPRQNIKIWSLFGWFLGIPRSRMVGSCDGFDGGDSGDRWRKRRATMVEHRGRQLPSQLLIWGKNHHHLMAPHHHHHNTHHHHHHYHHHHRLMSKISYAKQEPKTIALLLFTCLLKTSWMVSLLGNSISLPLLCIAVYSGWKWVFYIWRM